MSREVIAMNEMAYMFTRLIEMMAGVWLVVITTRLFGSMAKSFWITPRSFIKYRAGERKEEQEISGTPQQQLPSTQPPSTKPRPAPQPVPSYPAQCYAMNYSWCGGERRVGNVVWDRDKGVVEFDAAIPDGCTCCFSIDAYVVEPSGKYYFVNLGVVGPYGSGQHHVEAKVNIPSYTRDIKINPRCSGSPKKQAPTVTVPCSIDVDSIKAWYDSSKHAVVASFNGKVMSNCFDCDCVVNVYAESVENMKGAKRLIAQCFTSYGHTRQCSGSFTVYGTDALHGHDIIRFYAVVKSSQKGFEKTYELGEVEVIW